jgi:hypothetical protein
VQFDLSWVIATITTVIGSLSTVIGFLYREQNKAKDAYIAWLTGENKRKDNQIERLIEQLHRVADVQDRGLSIVEKERVRR